MSSKKNITRESEVKILSENPLIFQISERQLNENNRFDVFYYHPKFLIATQKLYSSKFPLFKLENIAVSIKDGPHNTPKFVEDGIIFLQKGDIKEGEIDFERPKKITKEFHEKNTQTQAHPSDILIRKIGVGPREAVVVPHNAPPLHIFVTLALIRLKKDYNPYYVEIFLNSSFGRTQTERRNRGIGSPCLHLEDIKTILIPIPPKNIQDKIVRIIQKARKKKEDNLIMIRKIKDDLSNFLLDKLRLTPPKSYDGIISFTAVIEDRMDAFFYNPKFSDIMKKLKSSRFPLKKLNEIVEISEEQIDPIKFPADSLKYVQIQDVDSKDNKIVSFTKIGGINSPSRAKMLIKTGEILVPTLGGSMESISIVPEDFNNQVATNGFIILRTKNEELRYYISEYLKSIFGQTQLERYLSGTIMPSISKNDIENILIPNPNKKVLIDIENKVKKTNYIIEELRNESMKIIQESKMEVESLIIGN